MWFVATALSIGNFYSYTSATRQPALSFCPDQLMPVDQLLLFLTLTLFVSASPGPVMLAAMANGGLYGVRRAMWGMAGATLGNLVLIALSALGMGLLLKNSDALFSVIQWLGAAYLIWLGLKLCLQPVGEGINASAVEEGSARRLFLKSFGIALSNPKGLIYFGALFPQFIAPERPLLAQFALLVSLFVAIDLVWMLAYAKGGSFIMGWLRSPLHQRVFNCLCGGALALAGVLMLWLKQ